MVKRIILLLAVTLSSAVFGQRVSSFEEIEEFLTEADEQTLVLFDIDLVLLIPKDPALQMANWVRHKEILQRHYKAHPPDLREAILRVMVSDYEDLLLDPRSSTTIARLQDRGVPTLALTASFTGEEMFEERWDRLAAYDIDLSRSFPELEMEQYTHFPQSGGGYPMYYRGILFTNGRHLSKGELLAHFLDEVGRWPTRVVFVDDRQEHLDSVGEILTERGIDHTLLLFTGANTYPSQELTSEEMEVAWTRLTDRAKEWVCTTEF